MESPLSEDIIWNKNWEVPEAIIENPGMSFDNTRH